MKIIRVDRNVTILKKNKNKVRNEKTVGVEKSGGIKDWFLMFVVVSSCNFFLWFVYMGILLGWMYLYTYGKVVVVGEQLGKAG